MEHAMPKTTLITGANRGIGLAMAQLAARRGDRVLAAARRPGEAPALAELARHNANVTVLNIDVTDPYEMAAAAATEDTPIDLLICNAGQYLARGVTVRAFLPRLLQAPAPKIVVVSSIMASSERAPGGSYIYRASKAAATNLARNLAVDLKEQGVAVGAFHPGWVRTDMGTSASGLLQRFDALSLATTGVFEDYRGKAIPF
jgi:NAD(P)-dependent dehydrogenase (short-subunit alcohol dehydrogenase family)